MVRSEVKPLNVEEIQANMKEGENTHVGIYDRKKEKVIQSVTRPPTQMTYLHGNPDNVVRFPAKFQPPIELGK